MMEGRESGELQGEVRRDVFNAFARLASDLRCPICLETIQNAKSPPCYHFLCAHCWDQLLREQGPSAACPICKEHVHRRQVKENEQYQQLADKLRDKVALFGFNLHEGVLMDPKASPAKPIRPFIPPPRRADQQIAAASGGGALEMISSLSLSSTTARGGGANGHPRRRQARAKLSASSSSSSSSLSGSARRGEEERKEEGGGEQEDRGQQPRPSKRKRRRTGAAGDSAGGGSFGSSTTNNSPSSRRHRDDDADDGMVEQHQEVEDEEVDEERKSRRSSLGSGTHLLQLAADIFAPDSPPPATNTRRLTSSALIAMASAATGGGRGVASVASSSTGSRASAAEEGGAGAGGATAFVASASPTRSRAAATGVRGRRGGATASVASASPTRSGVSAPAAAAAVAAAVVSTSPPSSPISADQSGAPAVAVRQTFVVGDTVEVMSRTWPGINKPGGVGRVVAVNADGTYDIKYILGGHDARVSAQFIHTMQELVVPSASHRSSRRSISSIVSPYPRGGGSLLRSSTPSSAVRPTKATAAANSTNTTTTTITTTTTTSPSRQKGSSSTGGAGPSIDSDEEEASPPSPPPTRSRKRSRGGDGGGISTQENRALPARTMSSFLPSKAPATSTAGRRSNVGGAGSRLSSCSRSSVGGGSGSSSKAAAQGGAQGGQAAAAAAAAAASEESYARRPQDIVVLGTSLPPAMLSKLQGFVSTFNVTWAQVPGPEVTHVVCKADSRKRAESRTMKYLHGIVNRCWVVSSQWITDSLISGKVMQEARYALTGDPKALEPSAPLKARLSRQKNLPALFKGYTFVLYGDFPPPKPSRRDLESLLHAGDGVLLSNVRSQTFTGNDPSKWIILCNTLPRNTTLHGTLPPHTGTSTSRGPTIVSSDWLLDSISNYRLQPFERYRIALE